MTPPTVVLWDIDGTLVRSNGGRVSVSAFLRALREVADLQAELPYPKDSGGKTDQQIALEVLLSANLAEENCRSACCRTFVRSTCASSKPPASSCCPTCAYCPACPKPCEPFASEA